MKAPTGRTNKKPGAIASGAGIAGVFLALLCCVGPALFVTLGVGAGIVSRFESMRPLFILLALALFAAALVAAYGRKCSLPDETTAKERRNAPPLDEWNATIL